MPNCESLTKPRITFRSRNEIIRALASGGAARASGRANRAHSECSVNVLFNLLPLDGPWPVGSDDSHDGDAPAAMSAGLQTDVRERGMIFREI